MEWGGSKLPNLQVSTPKETGKSKPSQPGSENDQETDGQGEKRIRDPRTQSQETPETKPTKRLRERSPDGEVQNWRGKPSFKREHTRKMARKEALRKERASNNRVERRTLYPGLQ